MLVRFARLHKLAKLGQEFVDVAKRAIHAGKTYISDLVGLAQTRHCFFADHGRRNLSVTRFLQVALDSIGDVFDLLDAYRSLVARGPQPPDDLVAVELFAPSVF